MAGGIIETRDLTMSFGGHTAVNRVSLAIEQSSFTSIIGPNGAGKTTLFNLLSGQLRPTAGQVLFKGTDVTRLSSCQRTRLGMGRSFQITDVFPNLTVLENVRLAVQARAGAGYRAFTHYRCFPQFEEQARSYLDTVLLAGRENQLARNLAHGEKRKLELAIILALEPEILLLDEPTAGMSVEEVPAILNLLRQLKERRKVTVLLVEHKIDLVMSLSDAVVVLHNGSILAQGPPAEIARNEDVQLAYLGGAG